MYAAQGAYYETQVDWVKTLEARRAFKSSPKTFKHSGRFNIVGALISGR